MRSCRPFRIPLSIAKGSGPPGINQQDSILATEQCGGMVDDITPGGYGWASSNTGVATLPSSTLHTVAVGLANGSTDILIQATHPAPACPTIVTAPIQSVNVAKLGCTSSVTRGGTATCTVSGPSGTTVSGWKFIHASTNTVTVQSSATSLSWSGEMVASGTVQVTVDSESSPRSAPITVNNRTTLAFTAVNPTQSTGNSITCYNGSTATLASPPNASSDKGASCPNQAFSYTTAQVNDGGPNNGYQYTASVSNANGNQPTQFDYIVVTDLLSATTFYNAQCGTYSSTNSSGVIAGSELKQNVFDHEGGSVLSHWTEYVNAQNSSSNNVGTALDQTVAKPGTTTTNYVTALNNAGSSAISRIETAVSTEPCNGSPNDDSSQSCAYCGSINYSPYQSCGNTTPVPYCH